MNPIVMGLLIVAAVAGFLYQMRAKILVLPKLRKDVRFDQIGTRVWKTIEYAIVQKRMFRRPLAGIAHLAIFAAFVGTVVNELYYFARGFVADVPYPLPSPVFEAYQIFKDVVWAAALVGISYWLIMRGIVRPWRFRTAAHKWKAFLILGMISTLAVTEFFMQGAEIALSNQPTPWYWPVSGLFAFQPAHTVYAVAFWIHVVTILVFLNLLPGGKHFHILFAIPNVFTLRLQYRGKFDSDLSRLETEEKFGIATAADLTWKQAMDTYSCTECGRCLEYCPTALTDKPLTHRQMNLDIKHALYEQTPNLLAMAKDKIPELVGEEGAALNPETIWACTTCGSCESECPVFIDQVPRIIQLRQNLVMIRGEMPNELNRAFKGMEQHSNPWGINSSDRDKWAEGLEIPRASDFADKEIPLLYWIGCAGSFDDRVKKITLAMVKILRAANVPFCILGKDEGCTGDSARRLGNEYLFQTLASTNIETLKNYKVKKILTHCPHCLQTLKNDYKDLGGGGYEVVHHTELLADLIAQGKVKPTQHNDTAVVFHDSCYLTRYNGIVEAPRKVLRSVPSLRVLEFDNHGDKNVCCGAGGGRFWLEEKIGKRINHHRLEDGLAKNPNTVASGCPFCLTMLGDGIKDKGLDDKVGSRDVAEILAASL